MLQRQVYFTCFMNMGFTYMMLRQSLSLVLCESLKAGLAVTFGWKQTS